MPVTDTDTAAASLLEQGWRTMPVAQRMALVEAWSDDVRRLAQAGVRRRHPQADPVEVLVLVGRVLYGASVVDDAVEQALRARR